MNEIKSKAWSFQRYWKSRPVPTYREFKTMLLNIDNHMKRALCIMCYLTAGRISEIVKTPKLIKTQFLKKQTVIKYKNGYVISKKTLKDKQGKYIIDKQTKYNIDYPGIRKKDLYFEWEIINGKRCKIMYINLANRKNRKVKFKRCGFLVEQDKQLLREIVTYCDMMADDDALFNFQQNKAGKIIRKELGMNPHYIRDIRLTHLVTKYKFREQQLVEYAGWTDSRPASRYVRLDTTNIIPIDYANRLNSSDKSLNK